MELREGNDAAAAVTAAFLRTLPGPMEHVVRWEEMEHKRFSPEEQRRRREVTEMVAHLMD